MCRLVLVVIFGSFSTILNFVVSSSYGENNVCPTYKDYYTIKNNSRCWYDIAAQYNAPEIIHLMGYPVKEYKIPTPDGFILTMYRIPSHASNTPGAKLHPVYLQHGLISTCANFLGVGKDSLAFMLADAGYDVWLGNYRANNYSEEHMYLTVNDEEYWDHSMDEIVKYDMPAMFSTIYKNTGSQNKILYIGHSLGTSLALMYAAEYPEESERLIKLYVLMSPAYTLAGMKSPFKNIAPYGNFILDSVRQLRMTRIVSQAGPLRQAVRNFCLESPPLMQFCMQMYNMFYGPNPDFGAEIAPVYFNQLPGGTSLKILNHAADLVLGNFRKYNYFLQNIQVYGQITAPIYDIRKIKVPVYIVFSAQDWATTERDAWNLYRTLRGPARYGIKKINLRNFNHIDFIFGRNVRRVVYEPLIRVLNNFTAHY